MRSYTHRSRGFTLVEVLVVIVIITILASIVMVNVLNKPGEARVAAARVQIQQVRSAVELYKLQQARFPTIQQGLAALVARPTLEPVPPSYPEGGYLSTPDLPRDPWGHDFVYLVPGRRNEPFEIISYGRDGEPGGEGEDADLSSSDTNP
jgi:general secretion pathway protein G